jgi:type III pantothenate kinase
VQVKKVLLSSALFLFGGDFLVNPDVVVDVGNSRIKWGRCVGGAVTEVIALSPDAPEIWQQTFDAWDLTTTSAWAIASVHPQRSDALLRWLEERAARIWVASQARQLPVQVHLEHPDRVGIDRLLNAVAALQSWQRRRLPAVVVDAGSAVTVDWLDENGAFRGGSIFPGLRLMVQVLHDHTALLPLVQINEPCPYLPGLSTPQAIQAGVYYATAGGINTLFGLLCARSGQPTHIYLTGGDAGLLSPAVDGRAEVWPAMTLEGLRLSAEAQP